MAAASSNFAFLGDHDPLLARLPGLAEEYLHSDPNTALLKLRQFTELLARQAAARVGIPAGPELDQLALLRDLESRGVVNRDVAQAFHFLRKTGNAANHAVTGTVSDALRCLKLARQLAVWFQRSFHQPQFQPQPFVAPTPETRASADAAARVAELESLLVLERQRFAAEIARLAAEAAASEPVELERRVSQASSAAEAFELDEAETRKLIDDQLRQVGWTVDSATLTHGQGARPRKGQNLAIAEWPTASGPADYVLFVGLTPVAVVEAKRANLNVSGALQQAKRYSRGLQLSEGLTSPGGPWDEHRAPFAFSTNGRPYLRQLETRSGTWFCDLRSPENLGHALDGWYTPEGLVALLERDEEAAHEKLRHEPFQYGFDLRPYQRRAIEAVEVAIAEGRRELLLAMATGTGKTKTCIALIYRLLKAKRFRRVLFLVDRSALGEQAQDAFKDTRMEGLQTFADAFGLKELEDTQPDSATAVHVATVQGLVKRVLFAADDTPPTTVDQYDCIVVDECHRGYLLDRELSDTELVFRGFEDYISKYRRVLDYFDAVKIGLTATPALHTTQIFGMPVFSYSYREAVIDGWLVDHEPPVQIHTQLSNEGIVWKPGDKVSVYKPQAAQIELFTTPDEIRIDVEGFNRKVITEPFNRVVCQFLAGEIDPSSRQKTLIFAANDAHADLVVDLLKKAFAEQYGAVEDDAVLKITGAADKPLHLIRRFKNERLPNVAVTVDLLTTGVDVPAICNLVFLRRVSSRILFDQMLGRATRLCEDIGKSTFRVFDAVRIYESLEHLTAMQPVVVDPSISFTQLVRELGDVTTNDGRALVRDQLVAKLQAKKRHLSDAQRRDLEVVTGGSVEELIRHVRALPLAELGAWARRHSELGEILDRRGPTVSAATLISDHEDTLVSTERGYGRATKPDDYLAEFARFVAKERNAIPALVTVLTRPRDLTRQQLRELALALDRAGFSEASLATAWREKTNQDIAARIVGFIRQAAIGDPLVPYEQRVDRALQRLLASKPWSTPQRQWLQKIAAQTKANGIVDRAALDDPDLLFKREGGGFARLDKIFGGELAEVLDRFNDSLWTAVA